MTLKNFLEKLENIRRKHGNEIEVIMADNISVVDPVFSEEYPYRKNVVITDEE